LWQARRAISPATFKVMPHKVSEDVAVPLSAIPQLVAGVQELSREFGLPILCYGHAGDGNIHINVMYAEKTPPALARVNRVVEAIFTLVRRLDGTLSGEHGVGLTKAPYLGMELSAAAIALQRRLKQAFDPNHIMNPGKVFPPGPGQAKFTNEQPL
jgi:glycolate oxidase